MKWLQGVAESEQFRDEELMWIGVILDVSDRQQTLMALAQSQTQFNKVADSVPGMLYQLVRKPDGEMILTYVNNYCRDISGRSRGRYWETHQDESSGGS